MSEPVKILIVDDSLFMRKILKDILLQNEFEIVGEAENGREAVEKFKELSPDLVTMDITMPEMDGIDSLKEIIKIDSEAKVIMCSAMGQQGIVVDAMKYGARDFIIKPFHPYQIIQAIQKTLNSSAAASI